MEVGKLCTFQSEVKTSISVEFLEKTFLSDAEKKSAFHLWNSEYPVNLKYSKLSQFEDYLEVLEDQFHLLIVLDREIQGWYFDFLREEERWFGLILNSKIQGRGFGSDILSQVRRKRTQLYGWIVITDTYLKSNGQPYKSPQEFYLKNGFDVVSNIEFKTEKISAVKIEWRQ